MGQLATAIHTAAQQIPAAPVADPAALLTGPQLAAIFAQVEAAVAALELRAAGSNILSDTGPPSNSAGNDHDLYVNAANGDLWGKDAGVWAFLINLRGPVGLTGPRGATGEQGDAGLRGRDGAAGRNGTDGTDGRDGADGRNGNRLRLYAATPALSDGNLDDVAIVSTTGDLLEKTASGWAVRGNLKGPKGDAGTGGTGGTGGTANFPAQSAATANQFMQSTGTTGSERWATVVNNRVGWGFSFKNDISRDQRFFKATSITRIERDAGVSTLSYSINGGTAVNVVFTNNVFAPAANTPLAFPAGALITWTITYNANFTLAAFEIEGTETL